MYNAPDESLTNKYTCFDLTLVCFGPGILQVVQLLHSPSKTVFGSVSTSNVLTHAPSEYIFPSIHMHDPDKLNSAVEIHC